jgi:hypothetical protein
MRCRLGGGVEANPGLIGQVDDSLGPEYRRELAKHAGRRWAGTIGIPFMTTLPQGTWAPWTATIGTTPTPGSAKT